MKQTILFIFCLIALLSACKDHNSGIKHLTIADKSVTFKVTLDVVVKKDDVFSLYYTTNGTIEFTSTKTIWMHVKGNEKLQQITFTFPKQLIPTQVRLDFGSNQQQKDIYLTKIKMSYKGKAVEIPGTLIFSYFIPDFKKTGFDATTGLIRGLIVNGIRQSPSLYPKEGPFSNEIESLKE